MNCLSTIIARALRISLAMASVFASLATEAAAANLTASIPKIAESEILQLIQVKLQATLPATAGELQIEPARPLPSIPALANNDWELKVTQTPINWPCSYVSIRFQIVSDNKSVGEWPAYFKAKLIKPVWIVRNAAKKDDTLDTLDLALEKRDIIDNKMVLWNGTDPSSKLSLLQPISPGTLLYERCVRSTPVIRRGQIVTALFEIQSLNVQLKVEVLDDGAPGDFVRVRNRDSRKEFRGKVISDTLVQLTP